ncbi:MAG: hypothetical protein ABI647_00705 [Gemmatimonadota bacterium]
MSGSKAVAPGVMVVFLTVSLVGCGDSSEPDLSTMRLLFGAATANFHDCSASPVGLSIPAAGSPVSAVFFMAGELPDPAVNSTDFELSVDPPSRFARTGAFTGTILGGAPGSAVLRFGLYHKTKKHSDYGPCDLTVTLE